jgi:hypothetical protein
MGCRPRPTNSHVETVALASAVVYAQMRRYLPDRAELV